MDYAIGIDLGGTHIKGVAVDKRGRVLHKESRTTRDVTSIPLPGNEFIPVWGYEVKELISALKSEPDEFPHVGLCAPGLAAANGRSISYIPGRMTGLEQLDWTSFLEYRPTIRVMNDAQAALLGEVWQGAATGADDAVMLTVGTGVGGAIYADGQLLTGKLGRAGNFGHMCLDVEAEPDGVGIPGSLQSAIGECTILKRSNGKFHSTKQLLDAVHAKDDFARAVWDLSVLKLSCAIASLINIVDPEVVVIGGGISQAGELLFEPIRKHMAKLEWRPDCHAVVVAPALLGEWSGAIGAAFNAIHLSNPSNYEAITL